MLSPQRATSGVTVAAHSLLQPLSPQIAGRLFACCVKYCLSQESASTASMGSTDKHCSVSELNSGTLASSQSEQRATMGFHSDAQCTLPAPLEIKQISSWLQQSVFPVQS
jgi:hypothetical protein